MNITDPARTLEKALERNLLNVEHDRLLSLLDLTLEVHSCPSNLNETGIPRRCLPAGRQGSVPGGSVQCNDEVELPASSATPSKATARRTATPTSTTASTASPRRGEHGRGET